MRKSFNYYIHERGKYENNSPEWQKIDAELKLYCEKIEKSNNKRRQTSLQHTADELKKGILKPITFQFIPKPCYGINLHTKTKIWHLITFVITGREYRVCAICGYYDAAHCHEIWTYDDIQHIQTLIDIEYICERCHSAIHMDFHLYSTKSNLQLDTVTYHLFLVNNWRKNRIEKEYKKALLIKQERNKYKWITNFEKYTPLLTLSRPTIGDIANVLGIDLPIYVKE